MSESLNKITAIVVDILDVEEADVTLASNFRSDLEADSLDLVELIMAFEDEFGGEISDDDAQKIATVGDAVNYVEAKLAA